MPQLATYKKINVTSSELWHTVGAVLAQARKDLNWRTQDVEQNGGPSYKTVQSIEAGRIGTVDSLDSHARAVGLSLVDVLVSVLSAAETPMSPEAARIVRKFSTTTVDGRTALVSLANALPDAPPGTPSGPRLSPPVPRPSRPRKRR